MIDWYTLMELAKCGYIKNNNLPDEWHQIGKTDINKETGFVGKVFRNNEGEIVISFSGTDLFDIKSRDLRNDTNMSIGNEPPQTQNALALYNEVRAMYLNAKITVTGHSLGGSLAQMVAKKTGVTAVAYNPFSTGDDDKEYHNITNIINSQDFISMADINTQPGNIFVMPNDGGNVIMPKFNLNSPAHKLENMDLLDMQRYEKGSVQSFMDKMLAGEEHRNLRKARSGLKKVFDFVDTMNKIKHQLGDLINDTNLGPNISFVDKNNNYYNGDDIKYKSYNANKSMLYGGVSQDMHWVTINGEHVLLPVEY